MGCVVRYEDAEEDDSCDEAEGDEVHVVGFRDQSVDGVRCLEFCGVVECYICRVCVSARAVGLAWIHGADHYGRVFVGKQVIQTSRTEQCVLACELVRNDAHLGVLALEFFVFVFISFFYFTKSLLTRLGGVFPFNAAMMFCAASMLISLRASTVALAM